MRTVWVAGRPLVAALPVVAARAWPPDEIPAAEVLLGVSRYNPAPTSDAEPRHARVPAGTHVVFE